VTIRIARILGRANVGGPARTALALCRRLEGVEHLLIVGESGAGEGDLTAGVTDVAIEHVPGMRRSIGPWDWRATRRIEAILARFAPDVVHTHAAKAGVVGRMAARRLSRRPKLVHTFHGHVLSGYFPRPVSALFAALERRLARFTDAIVAVSGAVADELAGHHGVAPRAAIRVIENGVELGDYPPVDAAARRDARLLLAVTLDAARHVVVPARLVPIKGHAILFDALDRLPDAVLPLEVHLLGDGPLRGALERRAARMPAAVHVRFHGFRDDLPRVLAAADAVVLPSRNEGMPIALIEAMALGLPIVATAVGGVPDLIEAGAHGLLVPPEDPVSLAFAMARVLSDLALARGLGARARSRAVARHGMDRVVAAHRALYEELLAGPTRRD
jgi:glycosyltransferase involved in cell wall biosynthesis